MSVRLIKENEEKYIDEREDEVKEFFNSINFDELFNKIRETVGDKTIKFSKPELKGFNYNGFGVDWNSEDIVDKCGVIKIAFDKCMISGYGNGIYVDKKSNKLFYSASVHFEFELSEGGSNGIKIMSASFFDGKWNFR